MLRKEVLKRLLGIEVLLIMSQNTIEWLEKRADTTYLVADWMLYLSIIFGLFITYYVYSIKCRREDCLASQVFTGPSLFDIKWPGSECHKCGETIS